MRNYSMSGMTEKNCGCRQDRAYGRQDRMYAGADKGCPGQDENCIERDYALAMAYVPWQHFHETYEPDKALEVGTIFPELDKPFFGAGRAYR